MILVVECGYPPLIENARNETFGFYYSNVTEYTCIRYHKPNISGSKEGETFTTNCTQTEDWMEINVECIGKYNGISLSNECLGYHSHSRYLLFKIIPK